MSIPGFSKLSLDENKENKAPTSKLAKPKEKSTFRAPSMAPPSSNREPLSPKKGVAVNTKYMPAYMRPTSSSGRKTIHGKNDSIKSNIPTPRPKSKIPTTSRPTSSIGLSRGVVKPAQKSLIRPKTAENDKKSTLPRPKSSFGGLQQTKEKKKPAEKNRTITTSDRWSRLATPKHVKSKVANTSTATPKPISKATPLVAKTKPTKNPTQPKKDIQPVTPKQPTKPIIESTLGQKSCPREKAPKEEKKRRRTRFSVNALELQKNIEEWRATEHGQMSGNLKQFWESMSQQDSKSTAAKDVLMQVERLCKNMAQAPLNQDEKMNIMKEMPSNFPFVDIKLFAAYWKWYAEIGIKCGLPKEDIVDIIQQGKLANAQPMNALTDYFDEYIGRIHENPELGNGQRAADPDMSIFNLIDDDEDLELSVVFDPKAAGLSESEPSTVDSVFSKEDIKLEPLPEHSELENIEPQTTVEPTVKQETEVKQEPVDTPPEVDDTVIHMRTIIEQNSLGAGDEGSFFKLVVRRKKADKSVVLTPVRRSKRTQKKQNDACQIDEMAVGETIDLTDVVDSTTGETVNDNVIILL